MKLVVNTSKDNPRNIEFFTINGIEANIEDFGEVTEQHIKYYKHSRISFAGKTPSSEILNKYKITISEYTEVINHLDTIIVLGIREWQS